MTTIVYILVAVFMFGILIAVHELGHFLSAKICGVRVNEYSIGMGPAIWKKQKGETLYSWRAIPCGGYCAMEGEEESSDDPRALNNKGFWAKLLIFAAGAFMNFVTGLVIILILYSGAKTFYTPTIAGFAENCPLQSEEALQVGDTLLTINGERVYVYSDVSLLFGMNDSTDFDLTVRRNGEKVLINDLTMERREYIDQQGNTYTGYGLYFGAEKADFADRISYSFRNAVDFVRLVRLSLKMLVTGQAGIRDMSGPVGIVTTMTEVGQQSGSFRAAAYNIAYLAALIAVNLAVMNLLPLPALDGGKIFFLVVNAIAMLLIGKKIPEKYENYIHYGGLILLLAFMLLITFSDVWKLFQ